MTYSFQVLVATESGGPILRAEVAQALEAPGVWERFVELRMGAGPTVRIERAAAGSDVFDVEVTWGKAQTARSRLRGQSAALEAADRLAHALYEVRATGVVADV